MNAHASAKRWVGGGEENLLSCQSQVKGEGDMLGQRMLMWRQLGPEVMPTQLGDAQNSRRGTDYCPCTVPKGCTTLANSQIAGSQSIGSR